MYISDQLREELDFFKRMNNHFEIDAGKNTCLVENATDEILYICFAASLVMDYSEDGFFENFVITDKSLSGKDDMLIDAYALIETDLSSVRQLHLFQFKEYESDEKAASPIELLNFATFVNNNFVHPELLLESEEQNGVLKEIKDKCNSFLNRGRGNRIKVYCHYINNAKGITKSNSKQINETVMGRFLQDKQLYGFSVQVNGLQDILDLATDGKIRVETETLDILVDGQNSYRIEDNSGKSRVGLPKHVIVGLCNVNEFIRLQNKYHHNQLYSENIRLYLGDRGAVNKAIINTITSNDSIWFPYMNNGISIICDSLTIGNINKTRNTMTLTMSNMQIINGCQTVNALYSARYGKTTTDNFRASNVMVRIYDIDPDQVDFKMNIIKATNNQNAVKSYSLMANDQIQIEISRILEKFNILYDRKGESKKNTKAKVIISMTDAAIAYRAVYLHQARELRSGMGRNRVFKEGEYEKVFNLSFLDEDRKQDLVRLCSQLVISTLILDTVRDLIPKYRDKWLTKLPIMMKCAFYLSGYLMAMGKREYEALSNEIVNDYMEGNFAKLQGKDYPNKIREIVKNQFEPALEGFTKFYRNLRKVDKSDIDNLLKDRAFSKEYEKALTHL